MIALGIDTGLAHFGYALISFEDPSDPKLLTLNCLQTQKSKQKANVLASADNVRRARELTCCLEPIFSEANIVCAESISWPRNASAVGKLGMSWGVAAALAEIHGLPFVAASPQQIKKRMTGSASASKQRVQEAVNGVFPRLADFLERARIPQSRHEHPVDAVAAILTCRDSEIMRAALAHLRK